MKAACHPLHPGCLAPLCQPQRPQLPFRRACLPAAALLATSPFTDLPGLAVALPWGAAPWLPQPSAQGRAWWGWRSLSWQPHRLPAHIPCWASGSQGLGVGCGSWGGSCLSHAHTCTHMSTYIHPCTWSLPRFLNWGLRALQQHGHSKPGTHGVMEVRRGQGLCKCPRGAITCRWPFPGQRGLLSASPLSPYIPWEPWTPQRPVGTAAEISQLLGLRLRLHTAEGDDSGFFSPYCGLTLPCASPGGARAGPHPRPTSSLSPHPSVCLPLVGFIFSGL